MKGKNLLIILFLFTLGNAAAFAQVTAQPKQTQTPAPQTDLQAGSTQGTQQTKKPDECACLQPAVDAVQKAYTSVEEDEWAAAIKTCKETIESVKTLSKTCRCPEVAYYQKILNAYLKYAEGGSHLDGTDEPNCPYALKLYDEALILLKESIPKITSLEVKTNAKSIQEYAEEEQQFVKDECTDTKQPAKKVEPKQATQGQGPGQTKQ